MGSGKSYWAQQIAAATNLHWMDLDAEIEKENSMTIKEIFETEGEAVFRVKEKKALHKLASYNNIIIATGGGTPCFFDNMTWMNTHGTTIFINESVNILVQRLQNEKAKRPLISQSSNEALQALLENKLAERLPFYSQSKHSIVGSTVKLADFIDLIKG
jgi:shikimate kinase